MSFLPRSVFFVSLAAGLTALSLTSSAHAGSACAKDADCGDGFTCGLDVAPSTTCGSSDGKPCTDPTPTPAPTTGYCHEKPIACDSDAQCPAYLACVAENVGSTTCASNDCAPGEDCPPPTCTDDPTPPDAAKYCAVKFIECTGDSACPADFACNIDLPSDCGDVVCAPGEDCSPTPDCAPAKKACGPKQIDCQADGDCPSDWRCLSFEEESNCTGGTDGNEGSAGGSAPPTPTPTPSGGGSKTLDNTPSCVTTTHNFCAPKGYLAGYEHDNSALGGAESNSSGAATPTSDSNGPSYSAPKGTAANADPTSGSGNSDGGCSSSGRSPAGSGLLGAMLVGLAACAARRRR